jgi:hypothetical protein
VWGYAPLLVTLANTREALFVVNRPGNAPSHLDAAGWIDKAIALVAPHATQVCLRGDTDFALTAHFDRWAEQVDFVLGTDNIAALRTRADALPEQAWKRLARPARYENKTGATRTRRHNRKAEVITERGFVNLRLDHEDVAEFTYRPGKCARDYRVVVVRKNISRMKGETVLIDEIRYFFYFTTYSADTHTPAQIVALANGRCDQENIVGQLKSGINALHAPVDDLHSNWAYMLIAALAWNIKSWRAMRMPHRQARLHPDGVQAVPRHRHPHPRHDHRPGPRHCRETTGLHHESRPVLHRLDHHRTRPVQRPRRLTGPDSPRQPKHRHPPAAATPHTHQRKPNLHTRPERTPAAATAAPITATGHADDPLEDQPQAEESREHPQPLRGRRSITWSV